MEFNGKSYDQWHQETVTYKDSVYPVLGLAGEVGEFVELVKKAWRKDELRWVENFDREKAISELGDIVWYVTRLSHLLGFTLDQVLINNIIKLNDRRKNGKK